MNYSMWKAGANNDIRFLSIYGMSGCGTVYYSPCTGRYCDECHIDRDLYRVCPRCGSELPRSTMLSYVCSCGTAILTCGEQHYIFVRAYATPHPMFRVEEDVI